MIRTIVLKELKENFYSYKFIIISILLVVLVLVSIFIMFRDYQLRVENYEILRPESNQPIAIIPPTPLSIFVKGLDETMGRSFEIRFGGQVRVGSKQQSVNNLFRLFTTPDLMYIIKVILALCAMLFAFDMISGEKETGTLSLSLSNNMRRTSFLTGKWIGGFTSLIIPFFIALLLGIIIVTISPQVQFSTADWAKLVMFLLGSVFYIAFFLSLGLFISCITSRSASSLVISLFMWAVIVFVIPNLGNTLARQFVKIPSIHQLEMKRQHIWIKEVFNLVNNIKPRDRTISKQKEGLNYVLEEINSENDKLMSDYRVQFNGLANLSKHITRFSPAAAYTFLATDIAGTGIREENRLKRAVLRYKDMVWNKPTDSGGNILGEFPPFSFKRSSISEVLTTEGLMNLTILILFNILAFTASYVAFLRYDVR